MKLTNLFAVIDQNERIISLHETEEGAHNNIVNFLTEELGLKIINPVLHK